MEKDIQLGPEDTLKLSFDPVKGTARIENAYAGKQAVAGAYVELTIDAYLDLLKAAIPGTLDDTIINGLEAAMKFVPA